MEIFLNKRAMRQVRLSVADAIEDGEIDALRDDLVSTFSDDDIEEIERRIDSGDFYDFVTEILDEWSGEDLDELMELLETQLADADVDLKYTPPEKDDEDEEEDEDAEAEEEEEVQEAAEADEEPQLELQPTPPPAPEPSEASEAAVETSLEELSGAEILQKAGDLFVARGRVAVSMLQREFSLDFKQATVILDQLQEVGLIGPYMGGKRRDILMTAEEWRERVGAL